MQEFSYVCYNLKINMATYGYDHMHFRSEDPHAARAYWENTFGATVVQERELGGAPSFTFDLNGMRFLVSGRAEGENPVKSGSDPRYGLDHFGLLVDDMNSAAAIFGPKELSLFVNPGKFARASKLPLLKAPMISASNSPNVTSNIRPGQDCLTSG